MAAWKNLFHFVWPLLTKIIWINSLKKSLPWIVDIAHLHFRLTSKSSDAYWLQRKSQVVFVPWDLSCELLKVSSKEQPNLFVHRCVFTIFKQFSVNWQIKIFRAQWCCFDEKNYIFSDAKFASAHYRVVDTKCTTFKIFGLQSSISSYLFYRNIIYQQDSPINKKVEFNWII